MYVPDGVFGATVKFPLASTLNGPLVTGVTSVLAVVTGFPFKVSFPNTLPPVDGIVSLVAINGLATTTVAVAVSQLAGLAPTSHNWYVMVYVPDAVFAASVNTPLASTLNGPLVTGVTSVLAAVTATPFKVSLPVTFKTVVGVVVVATVVGPLFTASIIFPITTVAIAVVQFAGLAPVSHSW